MNWNFLKKATSIISSIVLSAGIFGSAFPQSQLPVSAAPSSYKFDFGNGGVASGYTGVSANTAYSSSLGYGFNTPANMKDVTASGSGALSDAVQFVSYGTNSNNTFNVDLDNGLYQVTVTLGNTNRTSVAAEGVYQIMNMTGNNAVDTVQIPVTDGQLNINCTAGKEGYPFTLSALEITKISSDATMKPTVWLCGDSTVCNYYPLASSDQTGWGQILPSFVDTSKFEVRNMATGGQYAKGFMESGQWDAVYKYLKPGDFYFISIGINDTNYSNSTEYYDCLTTMTQQAKAKGATVIIVAEQGRSGDISNSALNANSGRWFNGTAKQVAAEQGVQCIDLFNLFYLHCQSVGQDAATSLYVADGLHPNRAGATVLAKLVSEQVDFEPINSAVLPNNATYMIKNVNSGLYLEVANGLAENGANVQQWGMNSPGKHNTWRVVADDDGYYNIYSALGDGNTFLLDLANGDATNGTNIGIWENTNSDAQLFKFEDLGNSTYTIRTKASGNKSCVEIGNALTTTGANVIQWESNDNNCQKWILEPVKLGDPVSKTYIKGDLNNDSVINAFDLALAKHGINNGFISKSTENAADINGDGTVAISDLVILQEFILGKIKEFPEISNNRYYAINATYYKSVYETTNTGYTGEAYVNVDNTIGSFIEWTVDVPITGNYLVSFNIANGSAVNRQMKIEVNNAADYWVQDFMSTGSWTDWTTRGIVLPLVSGNNIIRATSLLAEGGPNIDYIELLWTEEPVSATYVEPEKPIVVEKPVVYIAGDSTVQTYRASYAPQQGWGAYLGEELGDDVVVSNHAIAGRSSKSFYDNGRLDTILDVIKEGDYLLVQFAINDSAYNNAERYAPVCGDVNNPAEGSYEFYMTKYIEGALAKGATPVLVTTVIGLGSYSNGQFVNSYSNYCNACKDLAKKYNIPCIDLNSLMVSHYNSIGYDSAYYYHLISTEISDTDKTHFTETGAKAVAGLVSKELNSILK